MTASAAHDASVRMDVVGDAAAAAGDDWPVASDADVERWGVAFDAATGASALSLRDDEDEDARPRAPDDDRASRPGVSGAAAVPLLSAIGAPRDVLRRIWDLADADRSGLLTWDEFVLAMYLAERAAEGREPPAAIPNASGRWSTFPPREKKPREKKPPPPPDASPAKRGASRAFPGNDDAAAEISRSRAADASESTVPARPASAIKTLSPSTKPPLPARVPTPGLTPPGPAAERSSRDDYSPLVANTTTPPRVASPAALAKLHADAARRDAKLASARRAAEIRSALDDAADATHSPRINAYSRDIERSPAQTLERRAAGIAMRRERTRWERREWARMEEEEALAARSTHAGVARSDDAAFAERVEKWRRDEVERERRLERMRETLDAEARGARGRGAAARGSEASAVGRSGPWHERLYQSPRERTTPRRGSASLLAAAEEAEAEARAEEMGRGEGEAASEMGRGEGGAASEMGRGEGEAASAASSTASVYSPAAPASHSPAAGSAGASSAARLHLDAAARLARRVRAARADADAREDEARRGATLSRASAARDARRRRAAFLAAARPVVVVDPREEECDAAQIYGGSVDGDDVASTLRAAGLLPRDAGAGSRSITSRRAEALAVYRVCECLKTERPSPSSSADPPAAAKGRTFVPATLLATFVGAAVAETLGGSRVEGALRDGAANDDSHSPAEEKNPSIPPSEFVPSLEAAFDAGFAAASSLRSRRSAARPPWVPASFDGERAEAARDALDALVGAEAAFARLAATGETSGVYRRSSEEAIARSPQKPPLRRRAETDAPDESGAAARTRAEKGSFHHTSVANKESVADRLARKKARAEAALAAKRAARLDAERAECTFAPRISAASSAIVGSSGSRPRSFVRATEKYLTREEREALEAAACTFAPRITPRPRYLGKDPNATRREEEEKRRRAKERRRQSARDAPWEGPPPWESPPQKPRPQKKKPGTRERTRASSASPGTKTRAPASRGAPRGGSFGTAPASGPLARRPSGFEATVARLRAASAARAEAAKAARSAVDRRAAWIDPRAAEKKTAAEKTRDAARAKAAAAAEMPAARRASENARRDEATPAKTRGVSGGSKASATRDDGAETPGAKNEPGGPLSPALAKLSSTYTPGILPPRPDRAAFDASAAGEAAAFERAGRDADASEALAARTPADESPTVTMRVPPSPGGGRSPTPGRNRGGSSPRFGGSPALASATLSMTKNSPSLRHRSESRGATPSVSEDGLPYSPFAGPGRTILAMELSVGLDREKRDGSLRTATLEFRETDAVPAAAARFCDQHKLSDATRRDVEAVLETALRQYFAHASAEEDEQKGE